MSQAGWAWKRYRLVEAGLLLLTAVLFLLHFVHLRADFPNHSPWMDWAKYTDEGWYGDAAIRYYLRGQWRLAGDFNPGAALPVWPLLEAIVFRFTGVGIVAARALTLTVFGGVLLCSYLLVRSTLPGRVPLPMRRVFAAAAVAVMAASPFLYAFMRMAILEPLLILLLLCALLVAHSLHGLASFSERVPRLIAVGALTTLMIGTKTTAVFLVPAICCMLWSSSGWRLRHALRDVAVAATAAVVPAAIYLLAILRGGLLQDVRYLFSANAYTGITRETFWPVIGETFRDGTWIGPVLFPLVLATGFAAMFQRGARRDPVFLSVALCTAGYLAYIAYHANFQPRYYLVVAVPMVLLLARGALHLAAWNGRALYGLVPLLLLLLGQGMRETIRYVLHPEYSFQTAVEHIEQVVSSEPLHSHTVLSISGSNLSLMTGLPSICDDFGTMDLEDRIAIYKPGWFVTWNFVEDDKMQALTRFYRLTRIASFPAMDDPERNLMIVYRLDGKDGVAPKRRRPAARVPAQKLQQGTGSA